MPKISLKRRSWILVMIFTFLCPRRSFSQISPSDLIPSLQADAATIKPGTWVKYSIFLFKTRKSIIVRLTALDYEGSGQWLEMEIIDQHQQSMIYKILIEGTLVKPKRILKTIIQPAGLQPFLMPAKLADKQLPAVRSNQSTKPTLTQVKVKVPAGIFNATYFKKIEHGKLSEAWFSKKVSGWPMVKAKNSLLLLELAAYGKDGKTQVLGKPGKLDEQFLKKMGLQD